MLDYLWAAMLLLGVVWGLLHGRAAELTQAVLDGGKDAIPFDKLESFFTEYLK